MIENKVFIEYMKRDKMKYISISECVDGAVYHLHSRNLIFGIYSASDKGFTGIRKKFDKEYLFTEYHHDLGTDFATVKPLERIQGVLFTNTSKSGSERFETDDAFRYLTMLENLPEHSHLTYFK